MNKIEYLNDVNVVCRYVFCGIVAVYFLYYGYEKIQNRKIIFTKHDYERDQIRIKERARVKEVKELLDELEALDLAIENERDMDTLFILWKQRTEAGIKIEILIK